jgi:hypothetical protein
MIAIVSALLVTIAIARCASWTRQDTAAAAKTIAEIVALLAQQECQPADDADLCLDRMRAARYRARGIVLSPLEAGARDR